jgi:hypothetical protein
VFSSRIQLKAERIRQARQVVEDTDDVSHFKQRLVREAEVAQRLPVFFHHASGRSAELFGDGAQRALPRGELKFAPAPLLDRFDEAGLAALRTQNSA